MQVNTDRFNYCDGTFTAEVSDLCDLNLFGYNMFASGFELVSQRTGKAVGMRLAQRHHDREGDLTHWEFKPRNPDESRFKNLIIFND